MSEKIYQVFISSTYEDLKDERAAVEQVLISSDCMPVGMERFPSSNLEQFDYIKNVLEYVDYYILIIGGRYGTVNAETEISYTEMEYNYAVEKEIPILVFLKDDSVISKEYSDFENNDKLKSFIEKATKKRLRSNTFKNTDSLKLQVMTSINSEKNISKRPGWIRADFGNPIELLSENNKLLKENEKLKEIIEKQDELNEIDGTIKLNINRVYFYSKLIVSSYGYYSESFSEITIEFSKLEIIKTVGHYYFRNGNFDKSDIDICFSENIRNNKKDYIEDWEDKSKKEFEKKYNNDSGELTKYLQEEYAGFGYELSIESKKDVLEFLLGNSILETEGDQFKLSKIGKKIIKYNEETV